MVVPPSLSTTGPSECFVCIESSGDLLRGCACRGNAGFVHLQCLVQAAQANLITWLHCPTCKQEWTGKLGLGLARAKYALVEDRLEEDEDRLDAAVLLTMSLSESGEFAEAVQLGRETLTTIRRVLGDEHEGTLRAMEGLALTYVGMCDEAAALPLLEEILVVRRHACGNDHPETLAAIANLAGAYSDLRNYDAALPLCNEALERERRTLGNDHTATIESMHTLATLHMHMENTDQALPLYTESVERRKLLLGSEHPNTLFSVGSLGYLLHCMGDYADAAPLLEEAVKVLTDVYGEAHTHTRQFQEGLEVNAEALATENGDRLSMERSEGDVESDHKESISMSMDIAVHNVTASPWPLSIRIRLRCYFGASFADVPSQF